MPHLLGFASQSKIHDKMCCSLSFRSNCPVLVVWKLLLPVPILSALQYKLYPPMRNHDPSRRLQVIEFGYVTLFASAFPLAAAMSVISSWALWKHLLYSVEAFGMSLTMPYRQPKPETGNVIELKSDIFKLALVYQRPMPHRMKSIGCLAFRIWPPRETNAVLKSSLGSCNFTKEFGDSYYTWSLLSQLLQMPLDGSKMEILKTQQLKGTEACVFMPSYFSAWRGILDVPVNGIDYWCSSAHTHVDVL